MTDFTEEDINISDFARCGILRYIAKKDKMLAWELCQIYGRGEALEEVDSFDKVFKKLRDRKIYTLAMTWENNQAIAEVFHVTPAYVQAVVSRAAALRLRGGLGGRPMRQGKDPVS